jgi:hypothetical protein
MEDHLPYLSLEGNVDAPLLKAWIPAAVASRAFLAWSTVPVLQALVAKRVTTVQRFRLQGGPKAILRQLDSERPPSSAAHLQKDFLAYSALQVLVFHSRDAALGHTAALPLGSASRLKQWHLCSGGV